MRRETGILGAVSDCIVVVVIVVGENSQCVLELAWKMRVGREKRARKGGIVGKGEEKG